MLNSKQILLYILDDHVEGLRYSLNNILAKLSIHCSTT